MCSAKTVDLAFNLVQYRTVACLNSAQKETLNLRPHQPLRLLQFKEQSALVASCLAHSICRVISCFGGKIPEPFVIPIMQFY
jgi:hypothetical protein